MLSVFPFSVRLLVNPRSAFKFRSPGRLEPAFREAGPGRVSVGHISVRSGTAIELTRKTRRGTPSGLATGFSRRARLKHACRSPPRRKQQVRLAEPTLNARLRSYGCRARHDGLQDRRDLHGSFSFKIVSICYSWCPAQCSLCELYRPGSTVVRHVVFC